MTDIGTTFRRLLTVCVGLGFVGVGWSDAGEPKPPDIPWRNTKGLPVETVGKPIGVPVVKMLPLMRVPGADRWVQPFWYRAPVRKLHFCTLDLSTGEVKRHNVVPAHEIWSSLVAGDKLYLGYNVPSHLGIYDPATNSVRDLGKIFEKAITVYRLVEGPDGGILCAGANGSTEVAVYDPKADKVTNYGPLSDAGHGYVYYAWHDKNYIYGACRGSRPWQLVALHKPTGKREVLLETDVSNFMNIGGSVASVIDRKAGTRTYYRLEGGKAEPLPGPPVQAPKAKAAESKPEVVLDESTVYAEDKMTIFFRQPGAEAWREAKVEVPLEGKTVSRLLAFDENTVVGASRDYGPMFVYNIEASEMKLLGKPSGNAYSIARSGDKVYVSGYPSTWFDEVDLGRPFTPKTALPGKPAVPAESPKANPRRVTYFSNVKAMHSHCGVRMHTAPDGKVWVIGMKFRYYRGFALAWFDPKTGRYDKFDDGGQFDHLQVSWSCLMNDGKQMAITTRVQPNDQASGEPPPAAKIFILDLERGAIVKEYTPFADEKALLTIAEARDGSLIGLITEERYPKQSRTVLYKFDPNRGMVLKTREYGTVLAGVSAMMNMPRVGPDFLPGPDGYIWTLHRLGSVSGYPRLLVRIHPETLEVFPVGRVGAGGRFVFVGRDIYLAGGHYLRRVKEVAPEQ